MYLNKIYILYHLRTLMYEQLQLKMIRPYKGISHGRGM
jgi:hypothetical protein